MKTAFIYLLITIFCSVFGAVYELFSHEVYSFYMIYAFAIPLLGGVLPFMLAAMFNTSEFPGRLSLNLYNSGIAALTTGSIVNGVLEIYGTDNPLVYAYVFSGILFILAGIIVYMVKKRRIKNNE
ncbi:MAG: hypothetical protein IJC04_04045 [Oscillospiraceae bacterium]|nr:hypothetical protein [Oscillospiraceae bacterium]